MEAGGVALEAEARQRLRKEGELRLKRRLQTYLLLQKTKQEKKVPEQKKMHQEALDSEKK